MLVFVDLLGLYSKKEMFPKHHLTLFYFNQEPEVDDEVKESYFKFMLYICTKVSKNWEKYLSKATLTRENAEVGNNLTPSDEAYALWRVLYWYDDIQEEAQKYEELERNIEEYRQWKQKSLQYQNEYASILIKVRNHRKNKESKLMWDNFFWDKLWAQVASNETSMASRRNIAIDCPTGIPTAMDCNKLDPGDTDNSGEDRKPTAV